MPGKSRTALVVDFGCKINQYEGDVLRRELARLGFAPTDEAASADLAVVNTCTVTRRADSKARQLIRRLHREAPEMPIYVTGCYAVRSAATLRQIEGVRDVVADKQELIEHIVRKWALAPVDASDAQRPTLDIPITGADKLPLPHHFLSRSGATLKVPITGADKLPLPHHLLSRTRALLKVQDGCDAFCAYCIVPHVRPTLWSKQIEDVLDEARRLIDGDVKEIVLTGIHLGRYGADRTDGVTLTDVVGRVADLPGLYRLRLSSIEMPEVDEALIDLLTEHPVLCPHLHLPLQSGDDAVLAAMNRGYTSADYLRFVARLRDRMPDVSVTTDVIAGFPGETEDAFANTLRVCREAGFSRMHVFPFSARPGTDAAELPGHLPARVITERKKRLLAVADELAFVYKQRFLGKTVEVLVEETNRDDSGNLIAKGFSASYMRVHFAVEAELHNEAVKVRIESVDPEVMTGRSCPLTRSG